MSSWQKNLTKAPPAASSASGDTGIGRAPAVTGEDEGDKAKHVRDSQPRYSQYQLDEATKPLHAEIERLRAAPPAVTGEADAEMLLRREWWIGHGHSMVVLYGDDGEMQCHECRVWDYRRAPLAELQEQVREARIAKLAAAPPAAGAPPALVALVQEWQQADAYGDAPARAKAEAALLAWSPAPTPVAPPLPPDYVVHRGFFTGSLPDTAESLRDAQPAPVAPPAEQIGWLIERPHRLDSAARTYWGGFSPESWVRNADLAVRFARRQDAEHVRMHLLADYPDTLSAEHLWPAPPAVAGGDAPYCRECGADGGRVAYVETYADSEEWRCKDCGQTFSWRQEGQ